MKILKNNIDDYIQEKNIPAQLKQYFITSMRGKSYIDEAMLDEIEELYIYYTALYYFDETEFSSYIITTLERGSEHSAYYYYLKKILDNNLELQSKDNKKSFLNLSNIDLDNLFKEITIDFNKHLKDVYDNNFEQIDILTTLILLGKLELISNITEDQSYRYVYEAGKAGLETKIKNIKFT